MNAISQGLVKGGCLSSTGPASLVSSGLLLQQVRVCALVSLYSGRGASHFSESSMIITGHQSKAKREAMLDPPSPGPVEIKKQSKEACWLVAASRCKSSSIISVAQACWVPPDGLAFCPSCCHPPAHWSVPSAGLQQAQGGASSGSSSEGQAF